jgi:hypothetical protein
MDILSNEIIPKRLEVYMPKHSLFYYNTDQSHFEDVMKCIGSNYDIKKNIEWYAVLNNDDRGVLDVFPKDNKMFFANNNILIKLLEVYNY